MNRDTKFDHFFSPFLSSFFSSFAGPTDRISILPNFRSFFAITTLSISPITVIF